MPRRLGAYTVERLMAKGGMAEVYEVSRAGARGFIKRFALKRVRPELAREPEFADLFCHEARVCSTLSHPNIVPVVDFGEDDGELYLVMEYLDGVSSARLHQQLIERGETFPLAQALYVARSVLRGLHHVHQACDDEGWPLGLVHRDISPGNVLIGRSGEVKIVDFGIAQDRLAVPPESPTKLRGKPKYMSPEQVTGGPVDHRSDLFSLGAVLAEMVLGRPLFSGSDHDVMVQVWEGDLRILEQAEQIPLSLRAVLSRALAHEPQGRMANAAEFERELARVADQEALGFDELDLANWLERIGVTFPESGVYRCASVRPQGRGRRHSQGKLSIAPVAPPRNTPSQSVAAAADPRPAYRSGAPSGINISEPEAPDTLPPPLVTRGYRIHRGEAEERVWSLAEIVEQMATGQLPLDTPVSEDGTHIRRLNEIEYFNRLQQRPAFGLCRPHWELTWKRRLRRAELAMALFGLARRNETGLFELVNGPRRKQVYFRDGHPVLVISTDASELLGARLTRCGGVKPSDLEAALVLASENTGMHLGEALLRLRLLSPELLAEQLERQLVDRFLELGRWMVAVGSFYRGLDSGTDGVELRASGTQLCSDLVHASFDDTEVESLLHPFHGSPLVWRDAPSDLGLLGLNPRQERALLQVNRVCPLKDLVTALARQGTRPEDTLRAVFLGLVAGLLSMPGWPGNMGAEEGGSARPTTTVDQESNTMPTLAEWFFGGDELRLNRRPARSETP